MLIYEIMNYFYIYFFLQSYGQENTINYESLLPLKIFNYSNEIIFKKKDYFIDSFKKKSHIFQPHIFNIYLKNNKEYINNKLKINLTKFNNFFLWEIIPDVATNDFKNYQFTFNISEVVESLLNNIFPYELNKMIYEKKQLEKQLILDFQEQVKNLIKVVGSIRSKCRNFQYLIEEINKKKEIFHLLPEDELDAFYSLENYLLDISFEIISLFNQLDEAIIKSNFTLTQEYIDDLFTLYEEIFIHIKEKTQDYEIINYLNMEEFKNIIKNDFLNTNKKILLKKPLLVKDYNIFHKLPIGIQLNIDNIFKLNEISKDNFSFTLSVSTLITEIINYIFNRKTQKITETDENNKWINLKKTKEINNNNLNNKHINLQKILENLNKLLKNEQLLSVVKVKKIIRNHMDYINTQDDIITNILIKIIDEIIEIK